MALPWHLLAAALLVGLAGGIHCAGMCGGIVTALAAPREVSLGARPLTRSRRVGLLLWSHAGRIATYSLAGLAAGSLGAAAALLGSAWTIQLVFYALANVTLLAVGLRMVGLPLPAIASGAGVRVWSHVQPLFRHFYPARMWPQALALGMAWGCMPCGLVYSVLALALVSGGGMAGGLAMLAFGLGTLPHLLLAGYVLRRLQGVGMRRLLGAIVSLMGVAGIARLAAPLVASKFPLAEVLCRLPM